MVQYNAFDFYTQWFVSSNVLHHVIYRGFICDMRLTEVDRCCYNVRCCLSVCLSQPLIQLVRRRYVLCLFVPERRLKDRNSTAFVTHTSQRILLTLKPFWLFEDTFQAFTFKAYWCAEITEA
jgi:hypothetical protein